MSRRYGNDDKQEAAGHKFKWFGNNRFVCDVLEDMRKSFETLNFSALKGLIDEAQVMVNRMESALSDQKNLLELNEAASAARRAYRKLEREYIALEKKAQLKRPRSSSKKD